MIKIEFENFSPVLTAIKLGLGKFQFWFASILHFIDCFIFISFLTSPGCHFSWMYFISQEKNFWGICSIRDIYVGLDGVSWEPSVGTDIRADVTFLWMVSFYGVSKANQAFMEFNGSLFKSSQELDWSRLGQAKKD